MTEKRSLTPHIPLYRTARYFLQVMDGLNYKYFQSMDRAIQEQRGTPQENADWTEPEVWIPERLTGSERDLALHIWRISDQEVNPRHVRGCVMLAQRHELWHVEDNIIYLTDKGHDFINGGTIIAAIDGDEGLLNLLQITAEHSGQRRDLYDAFADFCRTYTTSGKDSVINMALGYRLNNLIDRRLISRTNLVYSITKEGLTYLGAERKDIVSVSQSEAINEQIQLAKLVNDLKLKARRQLHEYLMQMNPYQFEHVIKLLLEEMGYTNVEVTAASHDGGVDVVGYNELGISSVREVVQVKRYTHNVQRRVLDELRGSLHRFNAVLGTIITTSGFAKGTIEAAFEKGAAPITLIDGERLLDLLIEHEIGISKKTVHYLEFDPAKLSQFEIQESETNGGM